MNISDQGSFNWAAKFGQISATTHLGNSLILNIIKN